MTEEARRLRHYVRLLEAELHESQRRQQDLISALHKAKAELHALDGGALFYDGERLIRG